MKLNVKLLILLVILLSCTTIVGCELNPPNEEVCITLPSENAFCTYTMEDKERVIPKEEWMNMQTGRVSMSPESFGKYQVFVEQACELTKCTKKEKQAQKFFFKKVRAVNESLHGLD